MPQSASVSGGKQRQASLKKRPGLTVFLLGRVWRKLKKLKEAVLKVHTY